MNNIEYMNIRISRKEKKYLTTEAKKNGFTYVRLGKKVQNLSGFVRHQLLKNMPNQGK